MCIPVQYAFKKISVLILYAFERSISFTAIGKEKERLTTKSQFFI